MKQVTIDSNLVFFVDMKWRSTFRFSCHYIFVVYGFYSFFCCQSPICHLNYFRPINYIEAVPETNILLQLIVWSKKLFFSCQHFLFSLAKNTVQELGVLDYCKIHNLVKINTYFSMGREISVQNFFSDQTLSSRVKFSSTIFEISVTVTNASGIRSVGRLYSHMGAHFEAL